MRYLFQDFELNTVSHALLRSGHPLRVWPKVFDLLLFLVQRPGQLITKQQLLDGVWADSHVSESSVPWTISHTRRVLQQTQEQKQPIETVHGRGYRFTAQVRVLAERDAQPAASAPIPTVDSAVPYGARPVGHEPLVGREDVMGRLHTSWQQACVEGKGALLLLTGTAGIGKTSCLDVLAAQARECTAHVFRGRTTESACAPILWPFRQVLRAAIESASEHASQAGTLDAGLRAMEKSLPLLGEEERANTFLWFEEFTTWLANCAQEQPVLVLLDDIQWADTVTLELLSFIAPELHRLPVLLVAAQRSGGGSSLPATLEGLSRHSERIELAPFTKAQVAAYLRLNTAQSNVPGEIVHAMHAATAGNPLFLQHTLRSLVATQASLDFTILSPDAIKPAPIVGDVLRASIRRSPIATQELLGVASVLGERFELPDLAALAARSPERALAELEPALNEQLIIAIEPHSFTFCHGLLHAAVYDDTPVHIRTALHRRAADALAGRAAESYGEIARHLYRSLALGDYARVQQAAMRAARNASHMQAYPDAARYCRWAKEAQSHRKDVPAREQAENLLFLAHVLVATGDRADAERIIVQALDISRRHALFDLHLRAAQVLRPYHFMGSLADPLVTRIVEEALKHAPDDDELRIECLSQLAWTPPYALDMEKSKALSGEALQRAQTLGDPHLILRAQYARLHALSGPDDTEALQQTANDILSRGNVPAWACSAALGANLGAQLYRGDVAAADATLEALGQLARSQNWSTTLWFHGRLVVQRELQRGHLAKAATLLAELESRGQRWKVPYHAELSSMLQGLLLLERCGVEALLPSRDLIREGLSLAPESLRPTALRLLMALGDAQPAREYLSTLTEERLCHIPRDLSYLHALSSLGVLAIALDARTEAAMLYEHLQPYRHYFAMTVVLMHEGVVDHFLGMLAGYLGKRAEMVEHFEDAVTINSRLGYPAQLARTHQAYAHYLAQDGSLAEQSRARQLQRVAAGLRRELDGVSPLPERAPL